MKKLGFLALVCVSTAGQAVYFLDDGVRESTIGFGSNGGTLLWTNSFTVEAGAERITDVQVYLGRPNDPGPILGRTISFYLFSDNNADSIPDNGGILASLATTISTTDGWQTGDIEDVSLTVGSSFVVAAMAVYEFPMFIAGADLTTPHYSNRSWTAYTVGTVPLDPNNLDSIPANNKGFFETIYNQGGNYMVRAGAQPVPEPATISALMIGLAAVSAKRRRTR